MINKFYIRNHKIMNGNGRNKQDAPPSYEKCSDLPSYSQAIQLCNPDLVVVDLTPVDSTPALEIELETITTRDLPIILNLSGTRNNITRVNPPIDFENVMYYNKKLKVCFVLLSYIQYILTIIIWVSFLTIAEKGLRNVPILNILPLIFIFDMPLANLIQKEKWNLIDPIRPLYKLISVYLIKILIISCSLGSIVYTKMY